MAFDEGLADRVRSILQGRGELFEKRMFGALVFMINGHMCCGVRNTELLLRLSPEGASKALRRPHTRPLDATGKRIKSLVFVNEQGTDLDQALEEWVEVAFAFVRTLPPKAPGARGRVPGAIRPKKRRKKT